MKICFFFRSQHYLNLKKSSRACIFFLKKKLLIKRVHMSPSMPIRSFKHTQKGLKSRKKCYFPPPPRSNPGNETFDVAIFFLLIQKQMTICLMTISFLMTKSTVQWYQKKKKKKKKKKKCKDRITKI